MTEIQIDWNKDIEPDNKTEIEKYLNPFLFLIPKWCQTVRISVYSSDGEASISTLVDYEYRKITVDFLSGWFIQGEQKKQDDVVHECVHFFVNELYHQARRVVTATRGDNEKLKEFAFSELSKTVEAVTQDLTFAIINKFKEVK